MLKSGRGVFLFLLMACSPVAAATGQDGVMTSAPVAGSGVAGDDAAGHREASPSAVAETANPYGCEAPYTIPYDLPSQDHVGADAFAWQTFLGLNMAASQPSWASWTSTVDLIDCNQIESPAAGICLGGRFFPEACTKIEDFEQYSVLDQVGKVADLLLEAESKGLSSHPVITADGSFVRYQVLLSPSLSNWVIGQRLQRPATLEAMQASMTSVSFLCSDPAVVGTNNQSTILKLAWMEASDATSADEIYRRDLLVYTPRWLSSRGEPSCVKKTMSLVGMHIVRKTVSQPSWVWATFEHHANAPDCAALPSTGDANGDSGPSKGCPSTVDRPWSFYPATCQADGTTGACQTCNTPPRPNGDGHDCIDPSARQAYTETLEAFDRRYLAWEKAGRRGKIPEAPTAPASWCLDLPAAAEAGISRLCRQVPVGVNYPGATDWDATPPNQACQPPGSVWSKYQLIGTQWSGDDLSAGGACPNVQSQLWHDVPTKLYPVVNHAIIRPLLESFDGDDGNRRPFLANTALESYERSNCMGCHSKSTLDESVDGEPANLPSSAHGPNSPGSDFVYFLGLEVPAFEARKAVPQTVPQTVAPASPSPSTPAGQDPKTGGEG